MATQETFRRQVSRRAATKETTTDVEIETVDEDGESVGVDVFHFTRPSEEQLFLLAAGVGGDDANAADEAAAVMSLLRQTLPPTELRLMKSRLADPEDGLDMEILVGTVQDLMQAWSDFPTKPSSASAGSPVSSGARSTGRVRGQGSTRSTSP